MQPTAVMLWVLIWQLAAMAVTYSAAAALAGGGAAKALATVRGRGVLVYGVDLPVPHPAGLCRRGGSRCLLAAAAWRWQFVQAMVRPMVGVLKSSVASFIILALVWVKTEQLATLISFIMVLPLVYNNLCQGIAAADPEAVGDGKGVRAFRLEKTFPAAVICRQFCLFPVGSQQCAGTLRGNRASLPRCWADR